MTLSIPHGNSNQALSTLVLCSRPVYVLNLILKIHECRFVRYFPNINLRFVITCVTSAVELVRSASNAGASDRVQIPTDLEHFGISILN